MSGGETEQTMGKFRVEGDTETHKLTVTGQDVSREDIQAGLRLALIHVYQDTGLELTEDEFTLVGMALAEAHSSMTAADKARRKYQRDYWIWIAPVVALNLGAALFNLGRPLGWWSG
jgi:hypothetical protein